MFWRDTVVRSAVRHLGNFGETPDMVLETLGIVAWGCWPTVDGEALSIGYLWKPITR